MSVLEDLRVGMEDGSVDVVDLTAELTEDTPIIHLPEPFGNTPGFSLEEISRYDDRGPDWYWNAIHTGEHVGTHFDAPVHWVTGRDSIDVSQVPLRHLVAPAIVVDISAEAEKDPDALLEIEDLEAWQEANGPLPAGGWLLLRADWDAHMGTEMYLNLDETGRRHTPGISANCARWIADVSPLVGLGVETVGADAGASWSFNPPYSCHNLLLGAGKYGLTMLRNLGQLPATGTMLFVMPLPIVGGSGSPARVVALVPR
jgi:kynurenine formamidase